MTEIKILFECEDNKRELFFPGNIMIEDALIQYLKTTYSMVDLSLEKIIFLYKSKVLNSENKLKKGTY